MNYENVRTEMDGELLIVTLHRPEKRNAMTHQMRVDLLDCARRAETDDAVKAIVFTGHGEESFCAGANIPELEQRTLVSEMGPSATLRKELPTAIERLGKPSVAAINGYCFGAGLEFAMGCTVRIASENARLGLPEINFGQIPGSGRHAAPLPVRGAGLGHADDPDGAARRRRDRARNRPGHRSPAARRPHDPREGAGARDGGAIPHGLRRRARRRPALHGNGASGGHRLRAQALRHLHGDRGQPRSLESLRRKTRAPVQGPIIPGSRMKPSLLDREKIEAYLAAGYWTRETMVERYAAYARDFPDKTACRDSRKRRSPGGGWTNAPTASPRT